MKRDISFLIFVQICINIAWFKLNTISVTPPSTQIHNVYPLMYGNPPEKNKQCKKKAKKGYPLLSLKIHDYVNTFKSVYTDKTGVVGFLDRVVYRKWMKKRPIWKPIIYQFKSHGPGC